MWKDPIVEEVRAHRQAHAEKFDYDLAAICRDLRQQQAESGREVVTLPARRPRPIDPIVHTPKSTGEQLEP